MANQEKITLQIVTELVDKGLKQASKILDLQRKLATKVYAERRQQIKDNVKDEEKAASELKRLREKGNIQFRQMLKRKVELLREAASKELQQIKRVAAERKKAQKQQAEQQWKAAKDLKKHIDSIIDKQIAAEKAEAARQKRIQKLRRRFVTTISRMRREESKKQTKEANRRLKESLREVTELNREVTKAQRKAQREAKRANDKKKRDLKKTLAAQQRMFKKYFRNIGSAARGLASATGVVFGALTTLSYGLVNAFNRVVEVGGELEQNITNVSAIANLSASETEALSDKARELGASTAYTATQVAEAMTHLARAGLKSNKIMQSIGPTLYLAGAAGSDLSSATKLMARTMAQFNLEAKDASQVADTFTLAMQNSLLSMQSLDSSMRYAGAGAGAFGWDIGQTTAAVALFMDQTGMGSTAGTQFRHVLLSLAGPTREARKVMAELAKSQGVSYKVIRDKLNPATSDFKTILQTLKPIMKDHDKILKLVNKRSSGSLQKILKDFHSERSKFESLVELFKNQAGAAEQTYAKQMDTVVGKTKIFQSKVQESFLQLFDAFGPPLRDILDFLSIAMDEVIIHLQSMVNVIKHEIFAAFDSLVGGSENASSAAETLGLIVTTIVVKLLRFLIQLPKRIRSLIKLIKNVAYYITLIWITLKVNALFSALGRIILLIAVIRKSTLKLNVALARTRLLVLGIAGPLSLLVGWLATEYIAGLFAANDGLDSANSTLQGITENIKINTALLKAANKEHQQFLSGQQAGYSNIQGSRQLRKNADELIKGFDIKNKLNPFTKKQSEEIRQSILDSFFINPRDFAEQMHKGMLIKSTDQILPQKTKDILAKIGPKVDIISLETAYKIAQQIGKSEADLFKNNALRIAQQKELDVQILQQGTHLKDNTFEINQSISVNQRKNKVVRESLFLLRKIENAQILVKKAVLDGGQSQIDLLSRMQSLADTQMNFIDYQNDLTTLAPLISSISTSQKTAKEQAEDFGNALKGLGKTGGDVKKLQDQFELMVKLYRKSAPELSRIITGVQKDSDQVFIDKNGKNSVKISQLIGFFGQLGNEATEVEKNIDEVNRSLTEMTKKLLKLGAVQDPNLLAGILENQQVVSERLTEIKATNTEAMIDHFTKFINNKFANETGATADKQIKFLRSKANALFDFLAGLDKKAAGKGAGVTPPQPTGRGGRNLWAEWYKKLVKMEENAQKRLAKIRNKDKNKYILDLNDRLKKLRKFFAEGLRLARNNSKRRLLVLKRQNALMEKERLIAREKAVSDRKPKHKEIIEQAKDLERNELQRLEKAMEKSSVEFNIAEGRVAETLAATTKGSANLMNAFTKLHELNIDVKGFDPKGVATELENLMRTTEQSKILIDTYNKLLKIAKEEGDIQAAKGLTEQIDKENTKYNEQSKRLQDLRKQMKMYLEDFQNATSTTLTLRHLEDGQIKPRQITTSKLGLQNIVPGLQEFFKILDEIDKGYADVRKQGADDIVQYLKDSEDVIEADRKLRINEFVKFYDEKYGGRISSLQNELSEKRGKTLAEEHLYRLKLLKEELLKEGITGEKKAHINKVLNDIKMQILRNYGKEVNKIYRDDPENEFLEKNNKLYEESVRLRTRASRIRNIPIFGSMFEGMAANIEEEAGRLDQLADMYQQHQDELKNILDFSKVQNEEGKIIEQAKTIEEINAALAEGGLSKEKEKLYKKIQQIYKDTISRQTAEALALKALIKGTSKFLNLLKISAKVIQKIWEALTSVVGAIQTALGFLKSVIDKIKQGIDFMTGGRLELNPFTLMTEAADELLQKQEEFIQKQKDLQKEFRAGRITKTEYDAGMSVARAEKGNAAQIAKELVDNMVNESLRFMDALVKVAPIIIQRLIDRLPEITAALERMIPQLVLIIDKLFPAFVPVLTKMFTLAAQVFAKVVMQILFKDRTAVGSKGGAASGAIMGGGIGSLFGPIGGLVGAGLGGLVGGVFGDTPHPIKVRSQAGMLARFAHGDTVIAAKEPQELLRQALSTVGSEVKMATRRPPAPPPTRNTGTSSGGAKIDIAVIAEGRVLDAVQMQALERGHAPKIAKRLRKASGVKVGFNRGRYNKFAVNES